MLKIEVETAENHKCIRLIGRIRIEHMDILESQIVATGGFVTLDLHEVTLVDLAAVRFLLTCENRGLRLINCSPYIREWITRERGT